MSMRKRVLPRVPDLLQQPCQQTCVRNEHYYSYVLAMPSDEVSEEPGIKLSKAAKRFECVRCQRLFSRLEHLQRHERTRTFPVFEPKY